MNKWVQSPPWLTSFLVLCVLAAAAFIVNMTMEPIHPASTWGFAYGIGALAAFGVVLLHSLRRRTLRFRKLGRSWMYLQIHVYGGALFLLLVFMHSGFSIPTGVHTWWLWFLSIWVVGSGLLGIVIQKWIPTVLTSGLRVEVHYDRATELIEAIRQRCEKLIAKSDPRLKGFYTDHVAPSLAGRNPRLTYFFDITGGIHTRIKPFGHVRPHLSSTDKATLDAVQELFTSKLEIDAHCTLQRALRGWLVLHIPVSIVMTALLGFHLFSVMYY